MSETTFIDPGYLQPGTMVGAYRILDRAGEGGFGFLYRVERDGKTYALKLSRERLADLTAEDRAHNEERAEREILALKSLRHPNIVRVHSFERWPGLEDGFPYLVMDFIAGDQLYQWRLKGSPSLRRICEVLIKISTAVNYMHGLGLFHRDLKSENILVRSTDGEPILVDFGIARPKASYTVTRAQNTLGTITHYAPEYAAWSCSPEFYKGQPFEWKATTDLHSLGYVAYELFTGTSPFPRGRSEEEQRNIIINTIPAAPSARTDGRVPQSIDAIVLRLLEKDPEKRHQSGREIADAFQLALEDADATWDEPFDLPRRSGDDRLPATRARTPSRSAEGVAPSGGAQLLPLITTHDRAEPRAAASIDPAPVSAEAAAEEGPESRPVAPGGFNPPTSIGLKKNFTGIGSPAPKSSPTPEEQEANRYTVPTAIRKQTEALKGPAKHKVPIGLLVAGGLVAAVLLFMFIAATASHGSQEPKKANLLAEVERQQKAEAAAAPPASPPPEITTPIERAKPLVEPPAAPAPTLPMAEAPSHSPQPIDPASRPAEPPRTPSAKPSRKDADAIDAELARLGGRPVVPPPEQTGRGEHGGRRSGSSKPADPPWLRRSQRLPGTAVAASSGPGRGVPLGAHLKAKLLSNLDSRTIGNAPVEAMLATPYIIEDKILLPARTMLYGRGMASGDRFVIEFTRIRLPDNTEVAFTGLALDATDQKAGLVATRRIEPSRSEGPGVGSRVAKGAANTALGTVTGGLGKDLVRNAGSEVVNQEATSQVAGGGSAILLDAPVLFTIFVSAAF